MTDGQQEMLSYLEDLQARVRRGEVIGLAIGVMSESKKVQAVFSGQCAAAPLETLGVVRLMSRSVEDHMMSTAVPPAEAVLDIRKP